MGHYLTFDGLKTSDYGVEISGEGIFNSPERIYDMIEIPGRNGTLALDQGRYANIEVHYPAYNYETTLATFEQKLASLRSDFGSRIGYKRLTDTFHTDEYRLGVFKGGFEIDPVKYNTASQFELVFDCKPQRFLTSGETAVAVANNGTINNATRFDAQPLLEFKGYGDISINGETITVNNTEPGWISLYPAFSRGTNGSYTLDGNKYNTGDTITIESGTSLYFVLKARSSNIHIGASECHGSTGTLADGAANVAPVIQYYRGELILPAISFVAGTSSSVTYTFTIDYIEYTPTAAITPVYTISGAISLTFSYNGSTNTISYSVSKPSFNDFVWDTVQINGKATKVNSTKTIAGTIYIDLDIAEAYTYDNGSLIGLNNIVVLPYDTPVLPPGNTTITYSNTITNFKVTPRWWKL